jgi:glutamate---cysteine ligase / carboxylate-amine ligase
MREDQMSEATLPAWAEWTPSRPYSIGIEEEVMLLDPRDWSLAHRMESILPRLSPMLLSQVTAETHEAAIELHTSPHDDAGGAAREITSARGSARGRVGCLRAPGRQRRHASLRRRDRD